MNLSQIISRFNAGCNHLDKAMLAIAQRSFAEYEYQLVSAGGAVIGTLEWAAKHYLRQYCRGRMSPEDATSLHQPTFNTLIQLLRKYAQPPLEETILAVFEEYRRTIRNPAEHDASVPSTETLNEAVNAVRQFLIQYNQIDSSQLQQFDIIKNFPRLSDLKEEYFTSLRQKFEYLDLGGFSPRVGNKIIKIKMEDVFVSLTAIESVSLLESFSEDLARGNTERFTAVDWFAADVDEPEISARLSADSSTLKPTANRSTDFQRLLREPRLVLLGDPGSGKTTIGRHIAYRIAIGDATDLPRELQDCVPILVRASEYGLLLTNQPALSLLDYILDHHTSKYSQLFSLAISAGKALIIVDGLDEVASPANRILSSRRIEEFVSEFSQNRFVVTSRVIGYRKNQLTGSFKEVQLAPFRPDQALAFLRKWHSAVDQVSDSEASQEEANRRAQLLWTAIRENPGTRRLATNPLLLTIIALTSWRGTKLPSRRVELYQIATETLLENWPLRQRGQELRADELLSVLEPVAFEIFTAGTANAISEFDLLPVVEQKICEIQAVSRSVAQTLIRELLDKVAEHTGFFIVRGTDTQGRNIYGFLHMTFAEYLAARYLAEQWSSSPETIASYAHDARWREVILLMAGHVGTWAVAQVSKLVTDVLQLQSEYDSYLHRDLLLAASMLADNARVSRPIQDTVVTNLIELIMDDSCRGLTQYAKHLLKSISQVAPIGLPLTMLDPNPTDSADALLKKAALSRTLGHNVDQSIRHLVSALTDDSIPRSSRFEALLSLQEHADLENPSAILGIIIEGFQASFPISSDAATHLTRVPGVTSSIAQLNEGIPSGVFVLAQDAFHNANAKQIASKIISMSPAEREFLLYSLSISGLQDAICYELISASLSNHLSKSNRAASLRTANRIMHEYQHEQSTLLSLRQSLLDLANSDEDAALSTEAIIAFITLSENEYDVETRISMTKSYLDKCHPNYQGRLLEFIQQEFIHQDHWQSNTERSEALQRTSLLESLYLLLNIGDDETRRRCAYSIVESCLYTERDLDIILDAVNPQTVSTGGIYEAMQLFRTLLTDENLHGFSRQVAESLCEFISTWEPEGSGSEHDELEDILEFLTDVHPFPLESARSTVVGPLFEMLLSSPSPRVRMRAARLWMWSSQPSSIPISIVNKLSQDPEALSVIISGDSLDLANDPKLIEVVLDALSSESTTLSFAAVSALSKIRDDALRNMIVDRVVMILVQQKKNSAASTVLWNYFGPSRWKMIDSPFV